MAVEFNKQLKARIARLRKELRRASLIYVDIYSAKYHLISNTKYYGQYQKHVDRDNIGVLDVF